MSGKLYLFGFVFMVMHCTVQAVVTIKALKGIDKDLFINEELVLICEGDAFLENGYYHLQISETEPSSPPSIPFNKILEVNVATGEAKMFTVTFQYVTAKPLTGIKAELLGKKLNFLLEIKDAIGGDSVGHTTIDITLEGQSNFPPKTKVHHITDPDDNNARWIRFGDKTTASISGGVPTFPICTTAPCYLYGATSIPTEDYYNCLDVKVTDEVYLCSKEKSDFEEINLAGAEPGQILLDHEGKVLQVNITDTTNEATTIDLVVHKPLVTPTSCQDDMPTDLTVPVKCPKGDITPGTDINKVLLVSSKGQNFWFTSYTANNHDISGNFLSGELLEVSWDHTANAGIQQYLVTLNPKDTTTDNAIKQLYADCASVGTLCIIYFISVPTGESFQVTIQDIQTFTNDVPELSEIAIKSVMIPPKIIKDFRVVHAEPIATTVTENSIELDVCFAYITKTSKVNTHYEFLAVNEKGKWKKEIGDKKKDDSHACFYGLELPLADFGDSSKFFVLLRDSNNGKSLASGEVTLYLPALRAIKPEVDNNNNGSTSTLAIVGAAIGGIACLMALVAAAIMFVMKINRDNDGHQYPLHHNNIEDSNIIHGLDNPIPTM